MRARGEAGVRDADEQVQVAHVSRVVSLNTQGLEPVSTHDLRHSYVSRLIANGIDPVTVAALAGDKVETILRVYAHVYQTAQQGDLRARIAAAGQ